MCSEFEKRDEEGQQGGWKNAMTRVERRGELTLLLGDRENTISEWTFRLRSLFSKRSFTALYAAARAWTFEMIYFTINITRGCSRDPKTKLPMAVKIAGKDRRNALKGQG